MTNSNISGILLFLFLFSFSAAFAQKDDNYQKFIIHEDKVHPSMVMEYEAASKGLNENLKKHGIQGADYMCMQSEDFRYIFISPFNDFAEFDKNPFAELDEKMGKEASAAMWSAFESCYDSHGDYTIVMDKELSYMPDGITTNPEGQPFRVLEYWYTSPANADALVALAAEWKALCQSKGTKNYYRFYRNGFGTMGPYFMIATAAADPADFEKTNKETIEAAGEEGYAIYMKALKLTNKLEIVRGNIREDLSYTAPKMEDAAKSTNK